MSLRARTTNSVVITSLKFPMCTVPEGVIPEAHTKNFFFVFMFMIQKNIDNLNILSIFFVQLHIQQCINHFLKGIVSSHMDVFYFLKVFLELLHLKKKFH